MTNTGIINLLLNVIYNFLYPMTFKEKVLNIVKKIPEGKVLTYKQVAKLAGSPNAYRVVGNILNKNFDSNIPCLRVIRSDGKLGGYNRGAAKKKKLLRREGVFN